MRAQPFHRFALLLWCVPCLVFPWLRGRGWAHPELFSWWVGQGLGFLVLMGYVGWFVLGRQRNLPSGWILCLFLACLGQMCPLSFRTIAPDPALLWMAGFLLGFMAFRWTGRDVSIPWLAAGCVLSFFSISRYLDLPWRLPFIPYGNPNLMGIAVAAVVPQAMDCTQGKPWRRALWMAFLLAGVAASRSQASLLALGLGLCPSALSCLRQREGSTAWRSKILFCEKSFLPFLLCIWLFSLLGLPYLRGRSELRQVYESTVGIRLYIWEGAVSAVRKQPWVGWGPTQFQRVYPGYRIPEYFSNPRAATGTRHAHCEALERALEQGCLGSVPFFLWLGILFRGRPRHETRRSFQTSALILLLHGWMDITLRTPGPTLLFAMAAGAASKRQRRTGSWLSCLMILSLLLVLAEERKQRVLLSSSRSLWMAQDSMKRGDRQKALFHTQAGLFERPGDMDLLLQQGYILAGYEAYQDAEQCYRKILVASPGFGDVRSSLAKVLLLQGRIEPAMTHLQKAGLDNPYDIDNLWNLALAAFQLQRFEESFLACQALLSHCPSHAQALALVNQLENFL